MSRWPRRKRTNEGEGVMPMVLGRAEQQTVKQTVKQVSFCLPQLPISVNRIYCSKWINGSFRGDQLTDEAVLWRTRMGEYVPGAKFRIDDADLLANRSVVYVDSFFYYPYYHKNGHLRRFDVHNCLRLLYNLIAKKCGFDDMFIRGGSFDSENSSEVKVLVTLREVTNGSDDTNGD
jgi:hypothetical protein